MTQPERRALLEQYKTGKVTVEQVEYLLDTLPKKSPAAKHSPQHVYVQVAENGVKKTDVKIPFSMVKAGLKLGKSFGLLGGKYNLQSPAAQLALESLQDVNIDALASSIKKGEISLPYHIIDIHDTEEHKPDLRIAVVLK